MTKTVPKESKSGEARAGQKDESTSKSAFEKKLRDKCKNCTEGSIKVYLAAIKRLHKLVSDGDVPLTGAWLNKKVLMTKYEALPLSKRRQLSLAAVKAAQAYGLKDDKWSVKMFRDQSQ